MYMGDLSYFVRGLQTIVDILCGVEGKSCSSFFEQWQATVFGITDFALCAEKLTKAGEITEQQYTMLMEALFARSPSTHDLLQYFRCLDFHELLFKCREEGSIVKFTKNTVAHLRNRQVINRSNGINEGRVELMRQVSEKV